MKRDSFRIAPMSLSIMAITLFALSVPVFLLVAALLSPVGGMYAYIPGAFIVAIYASVWLWWRPTHFDTSPAGLDLIFPARTRTIPRDKILSARLATRAEFKERFGFAMRVGAGGLWGGFGWLWTSKEGWVEFYISRLSDYVLIERLDDNPLLITPERPEEFVELITRG